MNISKKKKQLQFSAKTYVHNHIKKITYYVLTLHHFNIVTNEF